MKPFALGMLMASFLVSGCDDDEVTWNYLAGPWRFEVSGQSFIEVFEREPPDALGQPDDHGCQNIWDEPTAAQPPKHRWQGCFLLSGERPHLVYNGCFGACSYSSSTERTSDDQMIIDYDSATRPRELGTKVTYARASDIALGPTGVPSSMVKRD